MAPGPHGHVTGTPRAYPNPWALVQGQGQAAEFRLALGHSTTSSKALFRSPHLAGAIHPQPVMLRVGRVAACGPPMRSVLVRERPGLLLQGLALALGRGPGHKQEQVVPGPVAWCWSQSS